MAWLPYALKTKEKNMSFNIQASRPQVNFEFCKDDEKISEAIESIFPMLTENAFLVWNYISIPLNYKYDISIIIEDVLQMLKTIRESSDGGKLEVSWPSNTFACDWTLIWDKSDLLIKANWRNVVGNTEHLLNASGDVNISVIEFASEWKMVLEVLIKGLEACNYTSTQLKDMDFLYREFSLIETYGSLYR